MVVVYLLIYWTLVTYRSKIYNSSHKKETNFLMCMVWSSSELLFVLGILFYKAIHVCCCMEAWPNLTFGFLAHAGQRYPAIRKEHGRPNINHFHWLDWKWCTSYSLLFHLPHLSVGRDLEMWSSDITKKKGKLVW